MKAIPQEIRRSLKTLGVTYRPKIQTATTFLDRNKHHPVKTCITSLREWDSYDSPKINIGPKTLTKTPFYSFAVTKKDTETLFKQVCVNENDKMTKDVEERVADNQINKPGNDSTNHSNLIGKATNEDFFSTKGIDKIMHQNISDDLFATITQNKDFIDKTLFIREVLKLNETTVKIICGPRMWGKSANLTMLRTFLSIDQGIPSPVVDPSDNPNRLLFKNTKIYDTEEFEQHFGRYPVIYLDLSAAKSNDYKEAIDKLSTICEEMQIRFKYLKQDPRIDMKFKNLLEMKRNNIKKDIIGFLKILCILLNDYYECPCVILIDEFDAPLRHLVENDVKESECKKIINFYGDFFLGLMKSEHGQGLRIMTGIFPFGTKSLYSGMNNYTEYKHIEGRFVDYYGFNEADVDELIDRLNLPKDKDIVRALVREKYNGYQIDGKNIYNTFSITKVFTAIDAIPRDKFDMSNVEQTRIVFKNYWGDSVSYKLIEKLFESLQLQTLLAELLLKESIMAELTKMSDASRRILEYKGDKSALLKTNDRIAVNDWNAAKDSLLSLLVCVGYLDARPRGGLEYLIRIPNNEIREILTRVHYTYITKAKLVDIADVDTAVEYVEKLGETKPEDMNRVIHNFCQYTINVFSKIDILDDQYDKNNIGGLFLNESLFHNCLTQFLPIGSRTRFFASELTLGDHTRPDLVSYDSNNKIVVIVDLKVMGRVDKALEQKRNYSVEILQLINKVDKVLRIELNIESRTNLYELEYIFEYYTAQEDIGKECDLLKGSDKYFNTLHGKIWRSEMADRGKVKAIVETDN